MPQEQAKAQRGEIAFVASDTETAQQALSRLAARYGSVPPDRAQVIVALGGDGFMLQTLHETEGRNVPVYGMNCGTIGFLMNEFGEEGLTARLSAAQEEVLNPLRMHAFAADGSAHEALAINEVALLRAGPQAAKLKIVVDGTVRMEDVSNLAHQADGIGDVLDDIHDSPRGVGSGCIGVGQHTDVHP